MPSLNVGDDVAQAYQAVRSDANSTNWAVFKYSGDNSGVSVAATGDDGLSGLVNHLQGGERAYAYLRVTSGDELSARAKFVFLTWVPEDVKPLQKARVSTDKAFVKQVVKDFSLEFFASNHSEISEEEILKAVKKAGGADYSTNS